MKNGRSITDEIKDINRLVDDQRAVMYRLRDSLSMKPDGDERGKMAEMIHDREIIVKSLELYRDVLEKTLGPRMNLEMRRAGRSR